MSFLHRYGIARRPTTTGQRSPLGLDPDRFGPLDLDATTIGYRFPVAPLADLGRKSFFYFDRLIVLTTMHGRR